MKCREDHYEVKISGNRYDLLQCCLLLHQSNMGSFLDWKIEDREKAYDFILYRLVAWGPSAGLDKGERFDEAVKALCYQTCIEFNDRTKKLAYELDALKKSQYLKLPSREYAREVVRPLLRQNRSLFKNYGPTAEGFDPEIWKHRVLIFIIPNNQKILAIIDDNKMHLSDKEYEVVEEFRIHVQDFESRYLHDSPSRGKGFPSALDQVFARDPFEWFDG